MSLKRLTKQEALKLITSVVDNEVDEDTKAAFFRYIEQDQYVRRQFTSAKRVKELMAYRCPVAKAPAHLKHRIGEILAAERKAQISLRSEEPVYDIPCNETPCSIKSTSGVYLPIVESQRSSPSWIYVSSVVILIIVLFWSIVYMNQPTPSSFSIEEYAYQYYSNNNGEFIQPTISTTNPFNAETALAADFNLPITVPPLLNGEFKGVVYADFISNFKTPLLEYYLPLEDQYVYIFAFDIETMNRHNELKPQEEAINSCVSPEDFHIQEINDKYVVTWKWNNTWYAAVSNQDGKTLASLVQPLQAAVDTSLKN